MFLANLALRKLALDILSVATMIRIFHAAGPCCRRPDLLFMHCVGEPAHDFFGEEVNLNRLIIEKNIIPHRDPLLPDRELNSDPLAAMRDLKDRFHRHVVVP
jgi:hypothetical protein